MKIKSIHGNEFLSLEFLDKNGQITHFCAHRDWQLKNANFPRENLPKE